MSLAKMDNDGEQARRSVKAMRTVDAPRELVRATTVLRKSGGEDVEVLQGLLDRARALRPVLLDGQAEVERIFKPLPKVHSIFWNENFYKILQPKRYGGLELGVPAFLSVIMEIARGCPSTAWNLALGSGHSLHLATSFSEQAQEEVFGLHGQMVAPEALTTIGVEVGEVPGGYEISGTWKYCSGAPYSTHYIGILPDPVTDLPSRYFVVKRDQYEVLDDWGDTIGAKGSGSNGITMRKAFVPHHLIIDAATPSDEPTPGYRLHGNPLYGGIFRAFSRGEAGSAQIGFAMAAIDEFVRIISKPGAHRDAGVGVASRAESPIYQNILGRAVGLVDSAVQLMLANGHLYEDFARRSVEEGDLFTKERHQRMQGIFFKAEEMAWEAVDMVAGASGAGPLRDGQRMQRYLRDAYAARCRRLRFDISAIPTAVAYLESAKAAGAYQPHVADFSPLPFEG